MVLLIVRQRRSTVVQIVLDAASNTLALLSGITRDVGRFSFVICEGFMTECAVCGSANH